MLAVVVGGLVVASEHREDTYRQSQVGERYFLPRTVPEGFARGDDSPDEPPIRVYRTSYVTRNASNAVTRLLRVTSARGDAIAARVGPPSDITIANHPAALIGDRSGRQLVVLTELLACGLVSVEAEGYSLDELREATSTLQCRPDPAQGAELGARAADYEGEIIPSVGHDVSFFAPPDRNLALRFTKSLDPPDVIAFGQRDHEVITSPVRRYWVVRTPTETIAELQWRDGDYLLSVFGEGSNLADAELVAIADSVTETTKSAFDRSRPPPERTSATTTVTASATTGSAPQTTR